ncbi:MAG TPA: hypothetical protein VGI81_17675 [Tepidisphaeraceae bacterium]|jgi:hypothetical protein
MLRGIEPDAFAARLLEQGLAANATESRDPTLELIEQWDAEDATDDPEEIARRQKDAEEFMESLAKSRIEMEGPHARKLWP